MQIPPCSLMVSVIGLEEQLGGWGAVRARAASLCSHSVCATSGMSPRHNYFEILRSTEAFPLRLTNAL